MAITSEELAAIASKFEEDDPTQDMFDAILAKVEQIVLDQFKMWQASVSAARKASRSYNRSGSSNNDEQPSEVGEEEPSLADKYEQQPSNVTSQRLFKKFGAVPDTVSTSPQSKKKDRKKSIE